MKNYAFLILTIPTFAMASWQDFRCNSSSFVPPHNLHFAMKQQGDRIKLSWQDYSFEMIPKILAALSTPIKDKVLRIELEFPEEMCFQAPTNPQLVRCQTTSPMKVYFDTKPVSSKVFNGKFTLSGHTIASSRYSSAISTKIQTNTVVWPRLSLMISDTTNKYGAAGSHYGFPYCP